MFYLYDGLGSTRALSDEIGTITDTYNYTAFGEIHSQTGSTENHYLFTGEQFDSALNQYYLRARYMNPGNGGRFLTMDTYQGRIAEPATLHKYVYAHSSPTYFTDPSGHFVSLGEFSAANTIQAILATTAVVSAYQIGQSLAGTWDGDTGLTNLQTGWLVLAALAGSNQKVFNLISDKVSERDERGEPVILYHGTSSNRASKIVSAGFRPGFDATVYFAEDFATASAFAYSVSTPDGSTSPESFSVIEFTIPASVAESTGLERRYSIGTCREVGFVDISGGSGYERCLIGSGNITIFNGALITKSISTRRKRLP